MNAETISLMRRLGYPSSWVREAQAYSAQDAYVAFDPRWAEALPEIPEATMDVLVRRGRQERPDAPALSYLGRTLTYGRLDDLVGQAAGVLREHGIGRGDVVAVMVPTSAMHWVVFFAIARLGAVHCGVNVMYRNEELTRQLADARPAALVCLDRLLQVVDTVPSGVKPAVVLSTALRDLADPAFQSYPALTQWWDPMPTDRESTAIPLLSAMRDVPPVRDGVAVDARNELGQIVYTAGTTGSPKGARATHFNLMHNALAATLILPTGRTPVTYSALPLFHTGGFFAMSLPVFARGGIVIPRPLFDVSDALGCIAHHRVNVLFGPPTLYTALLAHGVDGYDLSSLEMCATGAAPVPGDLPTRWEHATGVALHAGWGMTELNSMGTYNGLPGRPAPGTIGVPVVGEVRIVTDAGQIARRDQVGEIEYRGMQVSQGYLGKPTETAAAFRADGWFRTGDLGRIDADGLLRYVDRIKDLIVASGYNISPAEIENVLRSHPAISDAAVIGVWDDYRGEVPVAYVVGDVTAEDMVAYCRERLAAVKIPARVQVVEQLPKNAMGKTLKRVLRAGEESR